MATDTTITVTTSENLTTPSETTTAPPTPSQAAAADAVCPPGTEGSPPYCKTPSPTTQPPELLLKRMYLYSVCGVIIYLLFIKLFTDDVRVLPPATSPFLAAINSWIASRYEVRMSNICKNIILISISILECVLVAKKS